MDLKVNVSLSFYFYVWDKYHRNCDLFRQLYNYNDGTEVIIKPFGSKHLYVHLSNMSDTSKLKNVSNVLQAAKRLQKRKESKALVPAVERFRIDISE